MTYIIYKYAISPVRNFISLPKNAKVLTVQLQKGTPYIWVLLNKDEEFIQRSFIAFGTGWNLEDSPITDNLKYVGTFQLENGDIVMHLFEEGVE